MIDLFRIFSSYLENARGDEQLFVECSRLVQQRPVKLLDHRQPPLIAFPLRQHHRRRRHLLQKQMLLQTRLQQRVTAGDAVVVEISRHYSINIIQLLFNM